MFFLCTFSAIDTKELFGDPMSRMLEPEKQQDIPDLGIVVIGQAPDNSSYLALAKVSHPKLHKLSSVPSGYDFIFRQSWGLAINEDTIHRVIDTLRKENYPPIEDYIDGVVKGDTEQIAKYTAACLAVKEKYPLFSF